MQKFKAEIQIIGINPLADLFPSKSRLARFIKPMSIM
jgi:hypothetical protein